MKQLLLILPFLASCVNGDDTSQTFAQGVIQSNQLVYQIDSTHSKNDFYNFVYFYSAKVDDRPLGELATSFIYPYNGVNYMVTAAHPFLKQREDLVSGSICKFKLWAWDGKNGYKPYEYSTAIYFQLGEFCTDVAIFKAPKILDKHHFRVSMRDANISDVVYMIGFPNTNEYKEDNTRKYETRKMVFNGRDLELCGEALSFVGQSVPGFSGSPIFTYSSQDSTYNVFAINKGQKIVLDQQGNVIFDNGQPRKSTNYVSGYTMKEFYKILSDNKLN